MTSRNRLQLTLRQQSETGAQITLRQSKMGCRTPSPPRNILPSGSAGSSPHNPRKRMNDEIYLSSQAAQTSPLRISSALKRPSTAPERNALQQTGAQSSFERSSFGALRSNHVSSSSTSTLLAAKPEGTSSSTSITVGNPRTLRDAIKGFQDRLDDEYNAFEQKLNERDQGAELEDFDWDELEARYHTAIDPKVEAEQEIMNECSYLFRHFLIWMQMSSEREADRALKRLRTRIAFVQSSEDKLEEKKAHYSKVVNAFHSAMALLGNI